MLLAGVCGCCVGWLLGLPRWRAARPPQPSGRDAAHVKVRDVLHQLQRLGCIVRLLSLQLAGLNETEAHFGHTLSVNGRGPRLCCSIPCCRGSSCAAMSTPGPSQLQLQLIQCAGQAGLAVREAIARIPVSQRVKRAPTPLKPPPALAALPDLHGEKAAFEVLRKLAEQLGCEVGAGCTEQRSFPVTHS